jgi:hypothetical protein
MYPHRIHLSPDNIRVGSLYKDRRRRGNYKVLGLSRDESGMFSVIIVKQIPVEGTLDNFIDDNYWKVIPVKEFSKQYRLKAFS